MFAEQPFLSEFQKSFMMAHHFQMDEPREYTHTHTEFPEVSISLQAKHYTSLNSFYAVGDNHLPQCFTIIQNPLLIQEMEKYGQAICFFTGKNILMRQAYFHSTQHGQKKYIIIVLFLFFSHALFSLEKQRQN